MPKTLISEPPPRSKALALECHSLRRLQPPQAEAGAPGLPRTEGEAEASQRGGGCAEAFEFVPEDYFAPQNLALVFPDMPEDAPLEVDLGCGDGAFLVESARRAPGRRFLGVERLLGRVRRTCRRLARAAGWEAEACGAPVRRNARVLRVESLYLLAHLLAPGSVQVVHLLFPDPWPKRRHSGKRLFQGAFLEAAHAALAPGGELRFATDSLPYFEQARATARAHAGFAQEPWEPAPDDPQTDFERRFRSLGLPVHRMLLRKQEGE